MTSTVVITLFACVSQALAQFPVMRRGNVGPAGRTVVSAQSKPWYHLVSDTVAAKAATSPVDVLPPADLLPQPVSPPAPKRYDDEALQPAHHWARVPVVPTPAEKSATTFDLVAFQGETERSLFQRIVSRFSCPSVGGGRPSATWWSTQCKMETKVVEDKNMLPVVAMKGAVPCAAAAYTDASTNGQNTFVLEMLIRNAEEKQCVGGGAAIMCHLIRNSKNNVGAFSPLRFTTNQYNEPSLTQYLETFGCVSGTRSRSGAQWTCDDPTPPKCEDFVGDAVDAQGLQTVVGAHGLAQKSRDVISRGVFAQKSRDVLPAMMIAFFAASGIMLSMLRLRNRPSTIGREALLTA